MELTKIYVERPQVDYHYGWKSFINDLTQDWNNCIVVVSIAYLYDALTPSAYNPLVAKSAIILASDMAFLAIPDVPGNSSDTSSDSTRSLAEVLCYVSVLCSLGCIVSALWHGRRHGSTRMSFDKVVRVLLYGLSLTRATVKCTQIVGKLSAKNGERHERLGRLGCSIQPTLCAAHVVVSIALLCGMIQ